MRVLHVIPSLSPSQGGPSAALPLMARSVARPGVAVDVVTTDDDGPGKHLDISLGQRYERNGYEVLYFRKQIEFYKVSLPLAHWLSQHVREYDIIHIHALFSFSSNMAARLARRWRVPYIVRPLGVLNQWGLENRRRLLKKLSLRWIEMPILRSAAAIHYTSNAEKKETTLANGRIAAIRSAIIPLGIDTDALDQPADPQQFYTRFREASSKRLVLYLSRLDPIKGLDLLLPAFAEARHCQPNAMLVIAGDGEPAFVTMLQKLARDLGLEDHVVWTGFLGQAEKLSVLAAATVFVLPSYSENFGIAAAEALALGIPSILSDHVALAKDAGKADAALVVKCEVSALAGALRQLLQEPVTRDRLSVNARRLAAEKYSLAASGKALRDLYESIVEHK